MRRNSGQSKRQSMTHGVGWLIVAVLLVPVSTCVSLAQTNFRFDFGADRVATDYLPISAGIAYYSERGYGFESPVGIEAVDRGGDDPLCDDFCTSDKPFYFSIRLPEGNYRVTVTLGDEQAPTSTTVKAELRRLMLEKVETQAGRFVRCSFVVNIRTPRIPGGGQVRLKDRQKISEVWAWDDKLTLGFNGKRPCVCALDVTRADDIPTIYLLGDSTVCDQPRAPWNSWGQMLPSFFKPVVAVANHAESGETMRGSLAAGRIDKVFSSIKPGDYAFVQFGHNDMKSRTPNASQMYKADLKRFVADVRARGATPVLVTSVERKSGVKAETLRDYPAKVREVATEDDVALIDLHAMSQVLYRALGDDLDKAFQDGTHHNNYGSYELAKCVIEGIRQSKLELANDLVDDYVGFDPNRPDPVDEFDMPVSPKATDIKPLGD